MSDFYDLCNGWSRKWIEEMRLKHGVAYLGRFNYDRDKRKSIIDGSCDVFEEYTGQKVYNFSCDFCVPVKDDILEDMIREWNRSSPVALVDKMVNRIEEIGGSLLRWY